MYHSYFCAPFSRRVKIGPSAHRRVKTHGHFLYPFSADTEKKTDCIFRGTIKPSAKILNVMSLKVFV